jgi:hypothetical protein
VANLTDSFFPGFRSANNTEPGRLALGVSVRGVSIADKSSIDITVPPAAAKAISCDECVFRLGLSGDAGAAAIIVPVSPRGGTVATHRFQGSISRFNLNHSRDCLSLGMLANRLTGRHERSSDSEILHLTEAASAESDSPNASWGSQISQIESWIALRLRCKCDCDQDLKVGISHEAAHAD